MPHGDLLNGREAASPPLKTRLPSPTDSSPSRSPLDPASVPRPRSLRRRSSAFSTSPPRCCLICCLSLTFRQTVGFLLQRARLLTSSSLSTPLGMASRPQDIEAPTDFETQNIWGEIFGTIVETVTAGKRACHFSGDPLFFAINYVWALLLQKDISCVSRTGLRGNRYKEWRAPVLRTCVSMSDTRDNRAAPRARILPPIYRNSPDRSRAAQ